MVVADMQLQSRGVFAAAAQIDAVAHTAYPCTPPCGVAGTGGETPLLAVAYSNLEGNQWSGGVALVDAVTHTHQCGFHLATGVTSLAWCGIDGNVLALACDNGDVQLVRLEKTGPQSDFMFVPQQGNGTKQDSDDENDENPAAPGEASFGWGHDDVVTGVSASRFEKTTIATSSWDLTVKVWDIVNMDKTTATLEGHTDLIWSVAMNPSTAHLLASASQDCTVQVWDDRQPTDAALAVSTRYPALVVDWHPHKDTLFSTGLEDGSILTFDTRSSHAPLFESTVHGGPVHALKYSRFHEDLLASGGDDTSVYLINNGTASKQSTRVPTDHADYVRALDWFSSSSTACLATGAWDKTLRTWSMETPL
ncbi:Methylosome protein 50, partial [Globisporangium splendens]